MLLSATAASAPLQLASFRRLHRTARLRPPRTALIESLRTPCLIHYSAWLARRWSDPELPRAFPLVRHPGLLARPGRLREQIEAMAEAPLMS